MGMNLKTLFQRFKQELAVWRAVWRDPRTPWLARVVLGLAIGYAVTPFDIIPDFIPVLGHLDDVVIIPALIWLATRLTPRAVVADARAAVGARATKLADGLP